MFKDLKKLLENKLDEWQKLSTQSFNFNAEVFNDPKAKLIDWHPLKAGGSNFKTNKLVKVSPMLYKYTLSTQGVWFVGIFLFIGVLTLVGGLALVTMSKAGWGVLFFGVVFTGVSSLIFHFMVMPVYFDYSLGFVWKGRKLPRLSGDQQKRGNLVYINDVYAFQIIRERVRSKNSSYYSYEFNLVLKDNSRFNLIDHGNIEQIRADASVLSALFGKPIWDGTR